MFKRFRITSRISFILKRCASRTVLIGTSTGLILALASTSHADQNAPELDQLFQRLKFAQTSQDARIIENAIWQEWFRTPGRDSREKLLTARQNVQKGNLPGALDLIDEIISAHPEYAEAWNQRAIIKFLKGDLEGSLDDIDQTLLLEPRHFGAFTGRGQCLLRLRRYREALASYKKASLINPQNHSIKKNVFLLEERIRTQAVPI